MNKNIVMLMLVSIFLVTLMTIGVSAIEWDNLKIYDEKTKTVTIKNSLLRIIPTSEIATIKLNTPLNYRVGAGYGKVAEFEVNSYIDYTTAFKELEFYQRAGMRKFQRDFDYKYKTIEQVPDYETICDETFSKNGTKEYTNCRQEQIGFKQDIVWHDLTSSNFKENDRLTIGIFTNVEIGDKVEWIPNFYGERITEWAVWTADLNVGLVSFWKLNETSGNAIDSLGLNNGTITGATQGVDGLINNSYNFDGTGDFVNFGNSVSLQITGNLTISAWVNFTGAQNGFIFAKDDTTNRDYRMDISTSIGPSFSIFISNVFKSATAGAPIPNNIWVNVVGRYNGTHVAIFVNGTERARTIATGSIDNDAEPLFMGRRGDGVNEFDGRIDESGIWNRTLTDAEITQLYNNGTGITFTDVFITPPTITLISPVDSANFSETNVTFNVTVTDNVEVSEVKLFIDGVVNVTNTSLVNGTYIFNINPFSEGSHNWSIGATDDESTSSNSSTRTFSIDTSNPSIVINSPVGTQDSITIGDNETTTWNITDLNLDTCLLDYNGINTTLNCTANTTSFLYVNGINTLSIFANDTLGNSNTSTTTWNYTVILFNQSFNSPVLETSEQEFQINVSVISQFSVQSADLIYNGTNFPNAVKQDIGGDNVSLTQTIFIPGGTAGFGIENRSFFWNITVSEITTGNISSVTTASENQTVEELEFSLCDATLTIPVLNFTMVDEITGIQINATTNATSFQATFLLGVDASNLAKNISVNNQSVNTSEFDFCTDNETREFFTSMTLVYSAVDYSEKSYFLTQAPLSNVTSEITLFLLLDSASVEFFFTVERGLFPFPDVTVNIAKFIIGEGLFRTVEIDSTDGAGKFVSFLELDRDYRYTIFNATEVFGVINKRAICEAAPCEISLTIPDPSSEFFSGFTEAFAENVLYNLSFNASSKIVSFDFIDTTGLATSFRMVVTRSFSNQSGDVVSDQRVFTSSGSLTFNASAFTRGNFRVDTFIERSPDQFIDFITFIISDEVKVLGLLGLFTALLIILVVVFGLAFSPSMLIFSIPLALTLVKIMGFISLSNTAITMIYVLAFIAFASLSK